MKLVTNRSNDRLCHLIENQLVKRFGWKSIAPNWLPSPQLLVTLLILMFWPTQVTVMCWLNDVRPIDFQPHDAVSIWLCHRPNIIRFFVSVIYCVTWFHQKFFWHHNLVDRRWYVFGILALVAFVILLQNLLVSLLLRWILRRDGLLDGLHPVPRNILE